VVRRYARGRWQFNSAIIVDRQANSSSLIFAPLPHSSELKSDADELLGNIVHSTNNYLSAMMGFCELAMLDVKPEHIAHGQLQTVLESGNNAVGFTRDLLACARRSSLRPTTLPWRAWMSSLVQPHGIVTLGAVPDVNAMFDDVVMTRAWSNIIQFLREQQGIVSVESGIIDFSFAAATSLNINAGRYVWAAFSETQRNLTFEQAQHLFEPYYASKSLSGKKGLGLAPAAGIIQQSKGAVWTLSDAGAGISIIILLPVEQSEQFVVSPARETLRATPTPAIVPMVCNDLVTPALAQQMLTSHGFTITPISIDEATQIDWSSTRYPLHLSTQRNNPFWQGLDKNVVVWSAFAQATSRAHLKQVNVRLSLDATLMTQAINTLLKR
jgi:two-component system cell cycle sensor histidine kinase/response regulator CckA